MFLKQIYRHKSKIQCCLVQIRHFATNDAKMSAANVGNYSRFAANTILTGSDVLRISDYDCVGFDLDNTLLRYKLSAMVELEYEVLSQFLVEAKGYSAKYLLRPMKENIDFLQKGLIVDFARGNVMKIAYDGYILRVAHGTRQLTNDEIVDAYGKERRWTATTGFCEDLLAAWHSDLALEMRTLLDYFDMPASLVFARIIDSLDAAATKPIEKYNVWPDILDGLGEIFTRDHFESGRSRYFAELKANPTKYVRPTEESVKTWLTELRKHKAVFLLTGSHIDFANLTATQALGENWRDLFDIVVCFAKKPGFFTSARPFKELDGMRETSRTLDARDLKLGGIYSQGNWRDIMQCLQQKTNKKVPKVLYIGDNLIQDVYAPNDYCQSDAISIVEEMLAEGMVNSDDGHDDQKLLTSPIWGSYFAIHDEPSIWLELIRKHSKLCIPSVNYLATKPLDYPFKSFENKMCCNGFYPSEPKCFKN